tara:strand:+ start:1117 stop:1818 length:702 start_codon:yes stop_codon:yes gene_type:complete
MKLSIIVPCFNEEKNIPLILEKFKNTIQRSDVEVLLVNNGSQDNSKKILDELVPNYFFARIVEVKENQGYGFGITSGLDQARGEYIGYTHADLQTDPGDVIRALDIIENQKKPEMSYVKGNRKGRPFLDNFFTYGMSLFETIFLGTKLWDINAQPNIFHRSFFEELKYSCPKDFSLDLYFLYMAKKRGLNLVRFNVVFPKRIYGESSWNNGILSKWNFIKRTYNFSLKLKKEL